MQVRFNRTLITIEGDNHLDSFAWCCENARAQLMATFGIDKPFNPNNPQLLRYDPVSERWMMQYFTCGDKPFDRTSLTYALCTTQQGITKLVALHRQATN